MDISVTTIEMADATIVENGDSQLTISSNVENGTGPAANSPLIGGYLLVIIDEPHSQEHKDIILQKVSKGLLSWNQEQNLVNLEKELDIITTKASDGEVSRQGERLIQYASENLVTEVLINATSNTVLQCIRNLLSSFTRHRHIIHAGYTFSGSGSWILQDGTFSYADMCDALQDTEVQRVFEAYENIVSIDIHCSPEGEWPKLGHELFVQACKLKTNPTDVLTSGTPSITNFMEYIEPYVVPIETETLLESSDVVGNIRFSHPTLYVFPGGQGDSALFGINGFNMLIDGGFARKACFWDFTRHLDRLDAVLITRINNNNINGITAVLEKKKNQQVYPQIGHVFCNLQERKKLLSPSEDKEKDPLLIDLIEKSQQLVNCLRHINLRPQSCFRDTEPINLYHKVGHGTLNMFILSPAKDSREVRDFMEKWNSNDSKVFTTRKDSKELIFPIQNMISICALLIWEPAKPNENITRILFPGSTPQHKIFEGLEKIKHLEFFKTPTCSANTIVPSKSITALTKIKPLKSLDKVLQNDNLKPQKLATDLKKDKASIPIIDNKQRIENKAADDNKIKSTIDNKMKSLAPIKYPKKPLKSSIKKSESLESDKDDVKTDEIKNKENLGTDSETESKKLDEDKKVTKDDQKSNISSSLTKPRSKSKSSKSVERKPRAEIKPSTPKKIANDQGISNKLQAKSSPSATPAKSAKDANNRKVVESKYKSLYSKKEPAKSVDKDQPPKVERKPISRRPKPPSPMRKLGGSPVKSLKLNKNEKDSTLRKVKTEKPDTKDSSTVSTPVDVDSTKIAAEEKLSERDLELLKAQELADLKEEQEVIKEIEAVFSKDEKHNKPEPESAITDSAIPDEVEEYLIIEKEEFVEYSQEAQVDNVKTETTEISEEPAENLEKANEEVEESNQVATRPTEFATPITSTTKPKPMSLESCNKIENEVNEIIQSATDIIKSKEGESAELDTDKKEKVEEASRDISITSPEEKLELSSEKKTTDTKDIDEGENKDGAEQNYVIESQPDEKFSATSGATTAPTLPEDERITLDEIKEDKIPDIEEKYVNEETKEKDLLISRQPTRFEPKAKDDPGAIQFEAQQAHLRDIVKTPDEVADLPVHEEVDIGMYDDGVCDKAVKLINENDKKATEQVEENLEKEINMQQAKTEQFDEKDVAGGFNEKETVDKAVEEQLDQAYDTEKVTKQADSKESSKLDKETEQDKDDKAKQLDKEQILQEQTGEEKEVSVEKVPEKIDDKKSEKLVDSSLESSPGDKDKQEIEEPLETKDKIIDIVEKDTAIDVETISALDQQVLPEQAIPEKEISVQKSADQIVDSVAEITSLDLENDEKRSLLLKKDEIDADQVEKETKDEQIPHQEVKTDTSNKEADDKITETAVIDKNTEKLLTCDVSINKLQETSKPVSDKLMDKIGELPTETLDKETVGKDDHIKTDEKTSIIKEKIDEVIEEKEKLSKEEEQTTDVKEEVIPIDGLDAMSDSQYKKSIEPELEHIYAIKETWIRDEQEADELRSQAIRSDDGRFAEIPTDFKEPFSSLPYTTELRETHITTLDSPKPVEDDLEPTLLNNNKQSKLSTLLENSKELMQSTSKIISDIKSQDVSKSEQIPATRGIDVEKLVANVAEVLKSEKSLEEIASTIAKDIPSDKIDDIIETETIKSSEALEEETTENAKPEVVCVKESILNFLNEERKAFDEVNEVKEELEEEKDYGTEKLPSSEIVQDSRIKDVVIKKEIPIEKLEILDKEVSLPPISKQDEIFEGDLDNRMSKSPTPEKVLFDQEPMTSDSGKKVQDKPKLDTDIINKEQSTWAQSDGDVKSDYLEKQISAEDKILSKSPTPEKSTIVESLEKRSSIVDNLDQKPSKSPTPEKNAFDDKGKTDFPETRKSISDSLEQKESESLIISKSLTEIETESLDKKSIPEKAIGEIETELLEDTLAKSPTPEKVASEKDSGSLEKRSQSPTSEKSVTGIESQLEKPVSKSPTPEKSETVIKSEPLEKKVSKSPTPEKSTIEIVSDSVEQKVSKSPTPDKMDIEAETESLKEKASKSPTPDKSEALIGSESVEKKVSKSKTPDKSTIEIVSDSVAEQKVSKSPTPEKMDSEVETGSLKDKASKSPTPDKSETIIESESVEKTISKSPTPEKSAVEIESDSVVEQKISKSPTPEKTDIEAETESLKEKVSKSPTPDQSETVIESKSLEKKVSKSPTSEKTAVEIGSDSVVEQKISKSPTPEKTDIEAETESLKEKVSKSPTPDQSETVIESKSLEKKISKSPTPEKSAVEIGSDSVIEQKISKSPTPEKTDIEAETESLKEKVSKSPTPDQSETVIESESLEKKISKSPTPEKSGIELDSESVEKKVSKSPSPEKTDIEVGSESLKEKVAKSPTPEKMGKEIETELSEKKLSKSPTPEKSTIEIVSDSVEQKVSKSPTPEKSDIEAETESLKEKVSKSPTPDQSETVIESESLEKKVSKSPTPEKSGIELDSESVEKKVSKSPSPEKTDIEVGSESLKEKVAKSPTPEKTGKEIETELSEKKLSKSPTPEKSTMEIVSDSVEQKVSKSPTPEKSDIDAEPESLKEKVSKSPTPEKSETVIESEPLEKQVSKSPTPEKSTIEIVSDSIEQKVSKTTIPEKTDIDAEPESLKEKVSKSPTSEKSETVIKSEPLEKKVSKSPTPEKSTIEILSDSMEQKVSKSPTPEQTDIEVESESIKEKVSKSPTPEKSEKEIESELSEKKVSKSPTPEKSQAQILSESLSEKVSKSPTPERTTREIESESLEKMIIKSQTTEKEPSEKEIESLEKKLSKSPTPEPSTTAIESELLAENVSKSPTPEKLAIETESESLDKKLSKSPTPEKSETEVESDSQEKPATKLTTSEKVVSETESSSLEKKFSKSPTPEKSIIEIESEILEAKSPTPEIESLEKKLSKSPTPESEVAEKISKSSVLETLATEIESESPEAKKVKTETESLEKKLSESPTPVKSITEIESVSLDKVVAKSPTPEKVASEIVSESLEKTLSKSPTPEKSVTEIESVLEKKQSIVSDLLEKEELSISEKSVIEKTDMTDIKIKEKSIDSVSCWTEEKMVSETQEKRKSFTTPLDQDISKSPTPEKSTIEEKRESLTDALDHKGLKTAPLEKSAPLPVSSDSTASKSPTPEKYTDVSKTEETTKPIKKDLEQEKSKSSTPEKSISEEKIVLETQAKEKSISVSSDQITSKSPTPERSSISDKMISESQEKRSSIGGGIDTQESSKSTTPEKIDDMTEKNKSMDDLVDERRSKSSTPEKSIIKEKDIPDTSDKEPKSLIADILKEEKMVSETQEKRKSITSTLDQDASKSVSTEKSVVCEKADEEPKTFSVDGSIDKSSKSPTPEKPHEKLTSETSEKRKSLTDSTDQESSKSPTPEKSIIEEKIISETQEKQLFITEALSKIESTSEKEEQCSVVLEKGSSEGQEKREDSVDRESIKSFDDAILDEKTDSEKRKSSEDVALMTSERRKSDEKVLDTKLSKSPTPEKTEKESTLIETQKSIEEYVDKQISKSPTPEKYVIKETETELQKQKSFEKIEESKDKSISKSPTPEKSTTEENISSDRSKLIEESLDKKASKSPTPEKSVQEPLGKESIKSDLCKKTDSDEKIVSESKLDSADSLETKSPTPERSTVESTTISKSPTPDKETSEEKTSAASGPKLSTPEKSILESQSLEKQHTAESFSDRLSKSPETFSTLETSVSETQNITEDKTLIKESKTDIITEEKTIKEETDLYIKEDITKAITSDTFTTIDSSSLGKQESITESLDQKILPVEISKIDQISVQDGKSVIKEKSSDSEFISQNGDSIANGHDKQSINLDKEEIESKLVQDQTGDIKTKTFTSETTKLSHDDSKKSETETSYSTKIITNGAEIVSEKSVISKVVETNGESTCDITAKSIKTDDSKISTSYSKTIDTKEFEITHTKNGTSDISETNEILTTTKTQEFDKTCSKTHQVETTTNGHIEKSSKQTKCLIDDTIPDISVDSPVKSIIKHTDQDHTEDSDLAEGCLSTENLSPLHLSGRSTPEIKIDLDVDRQGQEEVFPLETEILQEEIPAGPSSTKTDITVLTGVKQSTEDLSLSGKSTPDIAEVEKLKEELKFEKYISRKSTTPKLPSETGSSIKDTETICVMKASKITTEKHELLTETKGKIIKEEIISTKEEKSIERSPELKLDKDEVSQHEITIETNTKIIKTVSEETNLVHDVETNGKLEQAECTDGEQSYRVKALETITDPSIVFSKTSELLSKTSESEVGEVSSPPSNMSSGQVSCAPNVWDEHFTDEEDIPESPLSVTSQVASSPTSQFQYDAGLLEESISSRKVSDTMSTSFYGSLPEETTTDRFKTEPMLIPKKSEHFGALSMSEEQSFVELGTGISQHDFSSTDLKSKIEKESTLTSTIKDISEHKSEKREEKVEKDTVETKSDKLEKPTEKDSASKDAASSSKKTESVESWGKPLGLPSPAPPGDTKSTPKKERKTAASILAAKNKKNNERKRSESPGKLNKKISPIYLDLTYVPHHGNANYCYVDFFKKVRARYYVFSGTEPSREVYNALLEAKQTWEDKDLEVTIIPTYDTDVLGYWVAENEELLSKNKIDLSPSASRCTINLQDHETSCSAYRLEF